MATLDLEFASDEHAGECVVWLFPPTDGDPTAHAIRWGNGRTVATVRVGADAAGGTVALAQDGRVLASADVPGDLTTTQHAALALGGAPHFVPRGGIDLYRAPLLSPPELACVLRETLRMIGTCAVEACPVDARSLAAQCLTIVLARHVRALAPAHVVRVLRDLAAQLPTLPDARARALATRLFGVLAWAEQRPRCGRVWLEISETHREVVLLLTRSGAFHVLDTEDPALVVPDTALVGSLRAANPGLAVHTHAYARALYTHIVAYGDAVLPDAPSAYAPAHATASTGAQVGPAERARRERVAAHLDRAALDVPQVVFAAHDAPLPVCNVFWYLFAPPGVVLPAPTPRVHNRLVANLNTSIAHKVVEIMLAVPHAPPPATRDACLALQDTVRLGMATALRAEFDRVLTEAVELVGQGTNSALGAVHARLALLALHLRAYV